MKIPFYLAVMKHTQTHSMTFYKITEVTKERSIFTGDLIKTSSDIGCLLTRTVRLFSVLRDAEAAAEAYAKKNGHKMYSIGDEEPYLLPGESYIEVRVA